MGNTKLTSIYPLTELWSMAGVSTVIVKLGIVPQTISLYNRDTWTLTDFIQLDILIIMDWESKNTAHISTGHKETVTDISLSLHKALRLMVHTYKHGCMTCVVSML